MTPHLHEELLAGLALDESEELSAPDRDHLASCDVCGERLAELRGLVATGRVGAPEPLRPPRPGLLDQIRAEVAAEGSYPSAGSAAPVPLAGPDQSAPLLAGATGRTPRGAEPERDDLSRRRALRRPTPRFASRVIAAAAVVAVAAGGILWYLQASGGDETVVSRATLSPLPDKSGEGTAQVVRRDGVDSLAVDVSTPPPSNAFEEIWLLNTDGRRMISLGILPSDGHASYPLPPTSSAGLAGYTTVDISIEPYDGNAAHSRNSVLRGTLE